MGAKWEEYRALMAAREEEACRALIRVPRMKVTQLAVLLNVDAKQVTRLLRVSGVVETAAYVPTKMRNPSYESRPLNYMKRMVRLREESLEEWAEHEGVRPRRFWPKDAGKMFELANVLVALRRAGLLYDKWDLHVPMIEPEGERMSPFQAWLIDKEEGVRYGLYVLPRFYPEHEQNRALHGLVWKLEQGGKKKKKGAEAPQEAERKIPIVFLVHVEDGTEYAKAMEPLLRHGDPMYLLPYESFTADPQFYLDALRTGERSAYRAIRPHVPRGASFAVPVEHSEFLEMAEVELGVEDAAVRLITTYSTGDIQRARLWQAKTKRNHPGRVPGGTRLALGRVYVKDEVMRIALKESLESVHRIRNKKLPENYQDYPFVADVEPWPDEDAWEPEDWPGDDSTRQYGDDARNRVTESADQEEGGTLDQTGPLTPAQSHGVPATIPATLRENLRKEGKFRMFRK
ncbi:MAG: hypothetical protein ACYCYO_17910 [Bacilli bacterium]